jgi:hypothetical protein
MADFITNKQLSRWLKEVHSKETEAEKAKGEQKRRQWDALINGPDAQPPPSQGEDAPSQSP